MTFLWASLRPRWEIEENEKKQMRRLRNCLGRIIKHLIDLVSSVSCVPKRKKSMPFNMPSSTSYWALVSYHFFSKSAFFLRMLDAPLDSWRQFQMDLGQSAIPSHLFLFSLFLSPFNLRYHLELPFFFGTLHWKLARSFRWIRHHGRIHPDLGQRERERGKNVGKPLLHCVKSFFLAMVRETW